MGGGWPTACLLVAVIAAEVCADGRQGEDRWSRLATAERRQGDWVPLTCANCRPVHDQGAQGSDSLPSVLTPPPRVEEARLLPPPPPPDGLLQQAATGFIQAYTQEQPPPRKQQQFLQETTSQNINRPQAQFLKSNGPVSLKNQHFLQEPVGDFRPPQQPNNPQLNRQPQLLQFDNQQFAQQFSDSGPYLNQPLFVGPQFVGPFFPQGAIPPQNIQPISPVQVQPQSPISPNTLSVNKQNFPVLGDRPFFEQQITTGQHIQQRLPQQTQQPNADIQEQYSTNETIKQNENSEDEEVQLLYVPVETLNQRARNVGKAKSLPSNQNIPTPKDNGKERPRVANINQNYEVTNRRPHLEDQQNFNTENQQSKHQYNIKQQSESLHHQLPPDDQERFNSQTHTVRQQFNVQQENDKFQQVENSGRFQIDPQITKEQYNVKQNNQYRQQIGVTHGHVNPQFQTQQEEGLRDGNIQTFNVNQGENLNSQYQHQFQHSIPNTNTNQLNLNPQINGQGIANFQQQLPPTDQNNFKEHQVQHEQLNTAVNQQFPQQQINQQLYTPQKQQPYINQPLEFEQQLNTEQPPLRKQVPIQPTRQNQFEFSTVQQENVEPISQTQVPDVYTTQQSKRQRHRNPHQDSSRNIQQHQNSQFTRQFPQDYQQSSVTSSTSSPVQHSETTSFVDNQYNQNEEQLFLQQKLINQQNNYDQANTFQSSQPRIPTSVPLVSSTIAPTQTTPAPNQPPLSVYMETTEDNKVNDVLRLLKNAKTIQVLDTVGPDSPQVFVGPSNLKPPSGYIKFELPYLNTLDSNRVERKVDKLPFFVAPLNFNPPPGYSKIPFPAPHIGSVVVSNVTVLKTALHEKPYENEPGTVSSSERYLDQFTLPAQISPISPQLPSLINSLQDEVYSVSPTSAIPTTTTETTTAESYTTPTYRGRGSNRGSQRGSSNYQTSATPSRRQQSRTRRPYDGRPYSRRHHTTLPTTTTEPSTEAPTREITPQPDQQLEYNAQNRPINSHEQLTNSQLQFGSQPNVQYSDGGDLIGLTQNQFNYQEQHFNQPRENLNIRQQGAANGLQNTEQYNQNYEVTQNSYAVETVAHTTPVPTVATPVVQQEEHLHNHQRNSGGRREQTRQHQRFRGRQRLTTTTTDSYDEVVQPVENRVVHRPTDSNLNYHRSQQVRNFNPQRLVENTHFESATPENKINIQTERADIGFQTTERLQSLQQENRYLQPVNKNQFRAEENIGNQFQQPINTEITGHNIQAHQAPQLQHQFYQPQTDFDTPTYNLTQPKRNNDFTSDQSTQTQYNINEQQPIDSQGHIVQNLEPQSNTNAQTHLGNDRVPNQQQLGYYEELAQQAEPVRKPLGIQNQQQFAQFDNEQTQKIANTQFSTPEQFDQIPVSPVEETSNTRLTTLANEEPQVQQYNQQRLVKYNIPPSRPNVADVQSPEEPTVNIGSNQFLNQADIDQSEATTTEAATTKASLVRLRGRVRSRQRGTKRNFQSTTTETPNYPTTYLSRQKPSLDKESNQEYSPRKRVNFNSRQTYTTRSNANKEEVNFDESNIGSNYDNSEKQVTIGRFSQNTDAVTTTDTPTTVKPSKRYQHILNRNKMRRARPTNAPSSSGTTKFILPTTPAPVTRLSSVRGRIRKPVTTKSTTTTEYPQQNENWNEKENFAPSAGSNEILEPLYQTREKNQATFGFQRNPVGSILVQKTSPKPIAANSNDDEYWNQGVTIQQSTSFDFKPDASAVTPPSFQEKNNQFQGTFSPIWNGQIELQDGNYYDVFNQKHIGKSDDQTPFSSDQQKVVYQEIKRRPSGKENQYNEKDYQEKTTILAQEDESLPKEKKYPVYREIIKPAESIQEETSQVIISPPDTEIKSLHEKDTEETIEQKGKNEQIEEVQNVESEPNVNEDVIKTKAHATVSGKKGRRRGSWVRVRVRKPQDMFEAAESQNLASLSENAIPVVTKAANEKLVWTQQPSTEPPVTATLENSKEPAETINFEEALKDMLKEFITNPEEGEKEETETEVSTDIPAPTDATNTTIVTTEDQHIRSGEVSTEGINTIKGILQDDTTNNESIDDTIKPDEPVKTVLPEIITQEVFTQEAVTVLPIIDNAETTQYPEETTSNDQFYNSQNSRVLGTSTTTEISLETEICYRGRCVKTKKAEGDSDLLTAE